MFSRRRTTLLAFTALVPFVFVTATAYAQNTAAAPEKPQTPAAGQASTVDAATPRGSATEAGPPAPATAEGPDRAGVQEIVVTAQRREQRLQDVPIAITAITQDKLQGQRVVSVADLSGIAPNVTVRPAAGASQIPSFTSRGITSYGVVPGSDKEFSLYLDGVYLGSAHSLFDLPDIERIEVLRGPQGTLFGRNSTSGAVSVITRDPADTFGVHQDLTVGNYQQVRSRTSVDTPAYGAFSGYVSYVHDERRGDIKNTGAGTFWDRSGPNTKTGAGTSPRYLGSKNSEQVFAALKFEPSDSFKSVYKFDYATTHYTPEGSAFVALNPSSPLIGSLLGAVIASQPTPVLTDSSARRPDAVNNAFVVGSYQKIYGHNLTSTLSLGDHLSVKNIAAYRYSFVNSTSQLDGLGGLTFTPQAVVPFAVLAAFSANPALATAPAAVQNATIGAYAAGIAPLVGRRFIGVANNSQETNKQWSDEVQATYTSPLFTLTAGGLYFHQKSTGGGPVGLGNTYTFATFPSSGRLPLGGQGISYNKATSIAGYAQAEVHITPTIDVVGGGRVTQDKKSGSFQSGGTYVFPVGQPNNYIDGTFTGIIVSAFTYKKTKFTYSGGVNYKPSRDLLVYGKYSTGFVSGGSIGGIAFAPETVASIEGGVKADLLDRRLRTNLALFTAKYKHLQSSQGGSNIGRPELGTVIVEQGSLRARGAELELTAVPVNGLTFNGNLGYTDAKYLSLAPMFQTQYGTGYKPTLLPKFTVNLGGQYESEPLFGDARFVARVDADWRSRIRYLSGSVQTSIPAFAALEYGPARWLVNTRVGLRDVGPLHLAVSFWTRNLTNNKDPQFPLAFSTFLVSTSFQQARTYGVDVSLRF